MTTEKKIKIKVKPTFQVFPRNGGIETDDQFYVYSCYAVEPNEDIEINPEYQTFTIAGKIQKLELNQEYLATIVKSDRPYAYNVESIYQELPSNGLQQREFFRALLTERQFKALYDAYGHDKDLIKMFQNDEIDISKVHGFGEETYKKIKEKIIKNLDYQVLISELSKYGITFSVIVKLIDLYGNADYAAKKIKEQPYSLTKVEGIGFIKADAIAKNIKGEAIREKMESGEITRDQGKDLFIMEIYKNPERIKEGIKYAIKENQSQGHTFVYIEDLIDKCKELLQIKDEQLLYDQLHSLRDSKAIYYDGMRVATKEAYDTEKEIALWFLEKLSNKATELDFDIDEFIEDSEKRHNIKLSEQQKHFFFNVKHHGVHILYGFAGCVDKDTEFFTGKGWKKISGFEVGDKVLQYNSDGTAELVEPLKYIKLPETEFNFLNTRSGSVNQMVSDDHDLVYRSSRGSVKKINYTEFKRRHDSSDRGFNGKFIPTFNYSGTGIHLSDSQIRVMVMIIADGHFAAGTKRCVIRLKKERKIKRARKILHESQILFNEKHEESTGYTIFVFEAPTREKEFNEYWYNCTQNQLQIIIDEVMYWDGSIHDSGRKRFSSTSKKTIDFIQFAFNATGHNTSIRIDDRVGQQQGKYIRKSICYDLYIHQAKGSHVSLMSRNPEDKVNIIKIRSEDGWKYCFTVPSGMWIMRREGKIVVTGNCGKSMLQIFLRDLCDKLNLSVRWLSPTGAASKVLGNYVERQASTVHKAIGYGRKNYDSDNTDDQPSFDGNSGEIHEDYIVIDETSMLDIFVLNSLLSKIKNPKARLLFIGDSFQIPSVAAGNLLHDMIESQMIPTTKLDIVFRQKEGGALDVATKIRLGEAFLDRHSVGEYEFGKDFIVNCIEQEQMVEMYKYYYQDLLNVYGSENIMVLSPKRISDLGTQAINYNIQQIVNPQLPFDKLDELEYGENVIFRVNDYVMNTKNTYNVTTTDGSVIDLVNGDKGKIIKVNKEYIRNNKSKADEIFNEKGIKENDINNIFESEDLDLEMSKKGIYVKFDDGVVHFTTELLNQLMHTWALTIHKSQGSGSDAVLIIIDKSHTYQMNANLLYTAITRLRKFGVLLCQPEVINRAIKKVANLTRNTFLQELLKENI